LKDYFKIHLSQKNYIFNIELTLEELFSGITKKFAITRNIICKSCNGSGANTPSDVIYCNTCKGKGYSSNNPHAALFSISMCSSCLGKGKYIRNRCNACKGTKTVKDIQNIEVKIEQGMKDGQTIAFQGYGDETAYGQCGNIIFIIKEKPHQIFKRKGSTLLIKKTISLVDALSGFELTINSIDGKTLVIPVTDIIANGEEKILANKGMPIPSTNMRGYMNVQFTVEFPKNLSIEKKTKIKRIIIRRRY